MGDILDIVLKEGYLIDGNGTPGRRISGLGIKDGRIFMIEEDASADSYPSKRSVSLEGCAILPGIVNAHVHAGFKYMDNEALHDFERDYLRSCLLDGVTTLRDEGMFTEDELETVIEKKIQLENDGGYPRIVTTGKFFSAPGGYGGQAPIAIESTREAIQKVNHLLDLGIDMVKTVLEDGIDPSTFGLPQLTDPLLFVLCDEAHRRKTKVSAHVTQAHNLKRLVEAGIDDAAHMIYDELPEELIQRMIEKGTFIVPTLTILKMFDDRFGLTLLKQGQMNVKRFVDAGGKIAVGNDYIETIDPWYPTGLPFLELQLLKECGLTEAQILQAATKHGAEVCNLSHELGTIEVGKVADFLIVKGNPEFNLDDLKNVVMVIKKGEIVVDNTIE
ncbi:MAG: hypothetical protein A2Y20_10005 [Firmicutes bacterium GWF2_51_9]|nr:MAG: hypothetical protein A2Y20_10005 [Firmicutes bacterium GWF2_51_9]OGS59346.1 MAG: hypothetical protein A2Y19_09120 [Firmicutes bacterium GWE2_51_13]HAM62370.1 hypothetical protein [Erysipelotrichaceae bacterium]HBZ40304.1 hypothetical protein [Erysipelotrichaceae bacterium]